MRRLLAPILLAAFTLTACDGDPAGDFDAAAFGLVDGQPGAVGVLAFLDDPGTTFDLLNDEVRLDRRSARNLVDHRNGPDGIHGTADDQPFRSIDEVLAVYWVGPSALERIRVYAEAQGWIPEGDDLLGVYDGVTFTVNEAEAALVVANTASEAVLRHEVGIQSRTVTAIVEARPHLSVQRLSEVRYVGPVSLERLREHGRTMAPPVVCLDDGVCPEGARCHGADGGAEGVCRHDDELLGIYDGVVFSYGDATATLVLANHGDEALLRGEVGLTARAVENIEAARPIATVADLSNVSYVGPVSLESLRDFARANPEVVAGLLEPQEPMEGCYTTADCLGDDVCAGIPQWGDDRRGECRDPGSLIAPNGDCSPENPYCVDGHICAGLTRGWGWGICHPEWMAETYDFQGFTAPAGVTVSIDWTVSGLASVPFDTVFTFDAAEDWPSLVITLENPYETVVPVWPHPYFGEVPFPGHHIAFPFTDEAVNGPWRLHVQNTGDTDVEIAPWSLYMMSHWD